MYMMFYDFQVFCLQISIFHLRSLLWTAAYAFQGRGTKTWKTRPCCVIAISRISVLTELQKFVLNMLSSYVESHHSLLLNRLDRKSCFFILRVLTWRKFFLKCHKVQNEKPVVCMFQIESCLLCSPASRLGIDYPLRIAVMSVTFLTGRISWSFPSCFSSSIFLAWCLHGIHWQLNWLHIWHLDWCSRPYGSLES